MKESEFRKLVQEEIKSILKEGWNDHLEDADIEDASDVSNVSPPEYKGRSGEKIDSYLFTVANNTDGREKIKRAKEALSPFFKFRVRGRHNNRKEVLGTSWRAGTQNDVPLEKAQFLAVYVDPK